MTAPIKDLEKLNNRQIESVKRQHDRTIKRMEDGHTTLKAEVKKAHEAEIVDIQHNNNIQVMNEAEKKEKVLIDLQGHLENKQRLTDKGLEQLKTHAHKESEKVRDTHTLIRERTREENDIYLEDLDHKFSTQAKRMNAKGKETVTSLKNSQAQEISSSTAHHNAKISHQTNQFSERFKTDAQNYDRMKKEQDNFNKRERLSTNSRQQLEMAKMTEGHNLNTQKRDQVFRKGIKDQEAFFEQRYEDTLKEKNADFKKLDDLHKKVISKMKTDMTNQIVTSLDKADDPFYSFTELRPILKHNPDSVEISVDIPDHAKQDVQLTFHGKEAIITFNRKYQDANSPVKGVMNKINKVETFVTRLDTGTHLEPKSVKSHYENGTMTYTIKKS